MSVFFNVDWDAETIEAKSGGQISIIINRVINTSEELLEGGETVFNDGVQTGLKGELEKMQLSSYDYPAPAYLDISRRSSTTASFYSSGSYVTACLDEKTEVCFEDNYLRTHSDGTKFICETNGSTCYRAK